MNLELRSILGRGDLNKERLTFRAIADLDIGDYIFMQVSSFGNEITTDVNISFWFPYMRVKKGDIVVLYTRSGSAEPKRLTTGHFAHFFYLNMLEPIWGSDDFAAVIAHAPNWEFKTAPALTKR